MPTTDSIPSVKSQRGGVIKHGHSSHAFQSHTYKCWSGMKQRCTNPKNVAFQSYAGRGITFCKEWLAFSGFLKDMGESPSALHTLERIDNNGNYEPTNCRWATMKEQSRNKRNNRNLTFKDQTKPLVEWIEMLALNKDRVHGRLRKGWSVDKAFTTPFIPRKDRWKMRKNAQPIRS